MSARFNPIKKIHAGADTYFQLGRADAPNETLIVQGHVSVYPYFVKGANAAQLYSSRAAVNRLTLGCATNPAVRATLKIASAPGREHTLYCGGDPGLLSWGALGGQLHVYNSTITAALADETHAFGANDPVQRSGPHVVMRGGVTMRNAVISWFKGVALWSARSDYVAVRDTVFEHGDSAFINSAGAEWDLRGCVFRQLRTAVLDWGGPVRATLTACAFSNNLVNWKLLKPDSRLVCVDCVFDDAANKRSYGAFAAQGKAGVKPPTFVSRRHLVVRALTAADTPVTNALVRVECEQAGWEHVVFHGQARTDAAGRTPGPESEQAILVTDVIEKAAAVAGKPEATRYTYAITVTAPGFEPSVRRGFQPAESWQIVDVRLNPVGSLAR